MMKTLYSKINFNRKSKFQISTKIVEDNGNVFVIKTSLSHDGDAHIKNCFANTKKMQSLYGEYILGASLSGNSLKYDFLKGQSLFEKILTNPSKFLTTYKDIVLGKKNTILFKNTKEFTDIFGKFDFSKYQNLQSLELTNVDLIPQNIIFIDDVNYRILDCEWCFEFPIPVDLVFYRAYLELKNYEINFITFKDFATLLEISLPENILEELANNFINYVGNSSEISQFEAKENYFGSALKDAVETNEKLNARVEELSKWGIDLDSQISKNNETIKKLNDEVGKMGELEDLVKQKDARINVLDNEISTRDKKINNQTQKLGELDDLVKQKDVYINKLDGELSTQKTKLNSQNKEICELKDLVNQKDSFIHKKIKEIDDLNCKIDDRNHQIDNLNSEVSSQKNNIEKLNVIVEEKSHHICELDDLVNQKNTHINNLDKTISEKDEQIGNLNVNLCSTKDELNKIKSSMFFPLYKAYVKTKNFFFPPNSKRLFFAKVTKRAIAHPIWTIKHMTPTNIRKMAKYYKYEGTARLLQRMDTYRNNYTENSDRLSVILNNMEKREEYPVLELPVPSKNPVVSIIIPVYNQFSYTYGCLEAIINNTKDVDYEVIIGDDCSNDETVDIKKYVKNIIVKKTKTNSRFLINCNNAAKYAKGKYILFLNNDTNVQPGWLSSLVDLIERDPSIGMVGSKLVYPNGLLQEAGGILWKDGSAWNYGNKSDPNNSEFSYVKEADYISGAAIMIHSWLWKKIGGFDRRYIPAYCEDSDLAFDVRKAGYKVVFDPFSIVVHYEGISNGTDVKFGVKKYQVENSEKFKQKWAKELSTHFDNAQNVFVAKDRSFDKKRVLFIDHYVPQYDKDAGSRTVFAYLKLLASLGYKVVFMGENFCRHEPYTAVLQRLGIEVLYGPFYANNYKEYLKENGKFFDIVFTNRPHITNKFLGIVKETCVNAKIIYYGHDLHFKRIADEAALKNSNSIAQEAEHWKSIEFDIFKNVDLIYYPSDKEVKLIKEIDQSYNVKRLQPYLFDNVVAKKYDASKRKDILFVGGFGHAPNFDGVKWFINDCMPKILESEPDLVLHIAGNNPPDELLTMQNKNIVVDGFVSDERLNELYNQVRLVVVPLRYGAGIKGKVIEAMAKGVPVVTTDVGAEGIDCPGLIIDNTMLKVGEIYKKPRVLASSVSKNYDFINKEYSTEHAAKSLEKDFKEVLEGK